MRLSSQRSMERRKDCIVIWEPGGNPVPSFLDADKYELFLNVDEIETGKSPRRI